MNSKLKKYDLTKDNIEKELIGLRYNKSGFIRYNKIAITLIKLSGIYSVFADYKKVINNDKNSFYKGTLLFSGYRDNVVQFILNYLTK